MTVPAKFAEALRRLGHSPTLVLAVSGGLDSMALLHLAVEEKHRRLIVAHFNHQLRGVESDGDEEFVRAQTKALGVEFHSGSADVRQKAKGISLEMAARELRHEFLASVAREHAAEVVLAHHADDQIELFLMRLLRGVEGPGLGGMRAVSVSPAGEDVRLLRPLLKISREELEGFVKAKGIPYREDSSNAEVFADRNRIRHTIVPAMRAAAGPDFQRRMLEHIESVRESSELKREAARAWLASGGNFESLPEWLRMEIVAVQLDAAKIPVTPVRLGARGLVSIGKGRRISINAKGKLQIHVPDSDAEVELDLDKACEAKFAGVKLSWASVEQGNLAAEEDRMVFDGELVGQKVRLRHWRSGDQIRLSGRASVRPLNEMFSRNKVPRALRNQLVVATTEKGRIFWVEGLRITEDFKVTPRTQRFLEWRWSRSHL